MKGSVPRWPRVPLGSLAEFRNGINYTSRDFGTGLKVINVKDFKDHSVASFDALDEVDPTHVISENALLREGDILFVRSNGNRDLIGRTLFVAALHEAVTHSAFTIRARFTSPEAHPRYFAHLFRSPPIRLTLSAHGNGTNISNLNQQILEMLPVPLPTQPEQARVANILSAYDDLIENNTRRIAILEEMARSLYREWFVNFRFPGHEHVAMVDSPLGPIPAGWAAKPLGRIARYVSRGISPSYDDEAEGLVINQKCIRDGRLNLELARRQSKPVPEMKRVRFGDILINSTGIGTLGRVAQMYEETVDCTADSHVSIVRPADESSVDFLGLALIELQPHFEGLGVGSTGQTELGRDRIGETTVCVPNQALLPKFSEVAAPMRRAAAIESRRNQVLRRTRDMLLPKLVSGELDVSGIEITQGVESHEG
jgi:type I restriction enzyme, S subunit